MKPGQFKRLFILSVFEFITVVLLITSCTEKVKLPIVATADITGITAFASACHGKIVNDGGATIISHGVCWSTDDYPTVADIKTKESHESVNGAFLSYMYQLDPATSYYVRAYATNSAGTGYGEQIQFVTLADYTGQIGNVTDIDGNTYKTIGIGSQIWMAENLKVTKYNDGTVIPKISDNATWYSLATGAFCDYENNIENSKIYGRLYNWMVAASDNPKNACPVGWHIPNWSELTILPDIQERSNIGGKIKETSTTHWNSPNTEATNETGFTALPCGRRDFTGVFDGIGKFSKWWSSTDFHEQGYSGTAWSISLSFNSGDLSGGYNYSQKEGYSIRCVKD